MRKRPHVMKIGMVLAAVCGYSLALEVTYRITRNPAPNALTFYLPVALCLGASLLVASLLVGSTGRWKEVKIAIWTFALFIFSMCMEFYIDLVYLGG